MIANTAGGSTTTLDYVWCGQAMCQARNQGGTVAREYLAEGEYLPGSPATAEYYAPDPVGTVRRVFTSSSATAYAYDPYGQALQATAPTTDFTYAGMFHEATSGLDLTLARAYDPQAGRWLTRDPLGEATDPYGNLYAYVGGNPVNFIDPLGLNLTSPTGPNTPPPPKPGNSCSNGSGSGNGDQQDAKNTPLKCEACGKVIPGGGAFYPYCYQCYGKSKDPNGGVPPIPPPLDPQNG